MHTKDELSMFMKLFTASALYSIIIGQCNRLQIITATEDVTGTTTVQSSILQILGSHNDLYYANLYSLIW